VIRFTAVSQTIYRPLESLLLGKYSPHQWVIWVDTSLW